MVAGFLVLFVYLFIVWLVFFRFRWLRFTPGWGVISGLVGVHLLLIFLIGLRFGAPLSANATMVQPTIQLVPRLPEPTLVTEVLVEQNVPVKKGQVLFRFDRRPYEYKVQQLEAELAAAEQNVLVLKADVNIAMQKIVQAQSELDYARYQQQLAQRFANGGAGPKEDAQKWTAQANTSAAALKEAQAEAEAARLRYESQIEGVNTTVASVRAQLKQAQYYLDNTTMLAPEDGRVINLQVRPGMVAGIYRIGGIAAFIVDADRYLLASYFQENLKYVERGQRAEVAFDLYPGQIFKGTVTDIWRANGEGQYLPSDVIPSFHPANPDAPQGQYAVQIRLDDPDVSRFPIGAQGTAAILTGNGGFVMLRKIALRAHSWLLWLYPLNV
ncbi:MAG TPA: biotin/lipoyl-binding protein [Acetobacteraceae bacterium]|nr:biotin/lipoyl-binding protein [Acetobacteraceae bacterium]